MRDSVDRHERLLAASHPRRARVEDTGALARLFTAAFANDPVFDWVARPGPKRAGGLERFFFWLLRGRAIPFGEVWMSHDGAACAAWLPPDSPPDQGGFREQMRMLALFMRLCGLPRLRRGSAMAGAMEHNHPAERHFYLAFIAVAPRFQGGGLDSAILSATLKRADETAMPAYLENSNPKNTALYRHAGFIARGNIAPRGAPPLIAMWRPARNGYASSSLSQ
ncbi:MAG: GNAT family N-acetyltransferase [Alphaproteobacteria bacterium]|nr:GNAT family N-acetyltransferase [Alphaproteobacteria bacterium]